MKQLERFGHLVRVEVIVPLSFVSLNEFIHFQPF